MQRVFQAGLLGHIKQLRYEIFVFTSSANQKQASPVAAYLHTVNTSIVHRERRV